MGLDRVSISFTGGLWLRGALGNEVIREESIRKAKVQRKALVIILLKKKKKRMSKEHFTLLWVTENDVFYQF